MQPTATSMQILTAVSAVIIAASACVFTVHTWSSARDAQLVQIGVSILEIDPKQQQQIAGAREWALNLIEANSGGVTFSREARAQLLGRKLVIQRGYSITSPIQPGINTSKTMTPGLNTSSQ